MNKGVNDIIKYAAIRVETKSIFVITLVTDSHQIKSILEEIIN